MAPARRTFRVFVSSTFEDLKAERDALQRDVFSRLRKRCEENSAFGQVLSRAIDMRWGCARSERNQNKLGFAESIPSCFSLREEQLGGRAFGKDVL
jgi:hypothetical protein